eukprot:1161676-Pelagomonas_calceolata.AAC.2
MGGDLQPGRLAEWLCIWAKHIIKLILVSSTLHAAPCTDIVILQYYLLRRAKVGEKKKKRQTA